MSVKELILAFVQTFRDLSKKSDGWRPAARHLGTDYQKLIYRVRQAEKLDSLVSWLEPMRIRLGLSKSAAWDKLVGNKKKS